MKPFLKWAGGKSRLVPKIAALLPEGSRLIEPFAGSGAVFMGLDKTSYLLADVNADLVDLYVTLRLHKDAFIEECRSLFVAENNRVERFMALRAEFNSTHAGERRRSALFVYLNRHCFNGLCRYNSSGGFNVPYGRSESPHFPERELVAFAERATRADILCQDFMATLAMARPGDVVYCDPPYVPLTATASFGAYAKGGFSAEQQTQLAYALADLRDRGIPSVVSNHDTPFTRVIYDGAHLVAHDVRRSISGDGLKRQKASELFAVYLPDGMAMPEGLVDLVVDRVGDRSGPLMNVASVTAESSLDFESFELEAA